MGELTARCGLAAVNGLARWLVLAHALGIASFAEAQTPQIRPSLQSSPLTQLDQLERDRRRADVPSVPRPVPAATLSVERGPKFTLKSVIVEGATAIDVSQLSAAYSPFIGRDLSEADVAALAAAMTEQYRGAGYHLSRAIVPPQDLAGGRLRVQVVEGVIEHIAIKGDVASGFGLESLLAPIAAERPARLSTLERQLLLANERLGLRITDTALDEIGTASGRFTLTVTAQSWRVFSATSLDNHGSEAVGPWQASSSLAFNSIFVSGDSLAFSGSLVPNASRELRSGRVAYELPLGTTGLRLGVSASRSEVWPGDARRQIGTFSQAETYEARIAYAPIVTQMHSLWLSASIGTSDVVEKDIFGKSFNDRIGLASVTADYKLQATQNAVTYVSTTVRHGMGFIDPASDSADWLSRSNASPHFSLLNASVSHYQTLFGNWSLKLSGAGQVASGPLLTSQQFYLGGLSFGRGFPGGWIGGDDAIAGSAELRYDMPGSGGLKGFQFYGFAEGGAARIRTQPGRLDQTLVSVGAGARIFVNDDLQFGLAVAKPIAENGLLRADRGLSVLFSLSNVLRFCPDRSDKFCRG